MKKALYIILALCLLFTLAACGGGGGEKETTEAKAQGNGITSTHVHCVCNGKAVGVGEHKTCSDKDGWVEISTAAELTDAVAAASATKPAYVALTADIEVDGFMEISQGTSVYVCLGGKTLTAATRNIGNLYITDCTGSGTWTTKKNNAVRAYAGSVCELYAGNITASDAMNDTRVFLLDGNADENLQLSEGETYLRIYGGKIYSDHVTSVNGACVYASTYGQLYLYNGVITGATVHTDDTGAGGKIGGNICLFGSNSNMYMYDGEVSNGYIKQNSAANGTTKAAWGGNIATYRGSLYVYGGVISGGYANGNGGNIGACNTSDYLHLENCTVKDGKTEQFGGNIYSGADATHITTLKNAIISGGEAVKSGGNLFFQNGVLTVEGGEFKDGKCTAELGGGIAFQGTDLLIPLSGNIKFENNQGSDILLRQHSSGKLPYLSLADLTTTSDIKIAGNALTAGYEFCKDAPANHTLKAVEGFTLATDGAKITITPNS